MPDPGADDSDEFGPWIRRPRPRSGSALLWMTRRPSLSAAAAGQIIAAAAAAAAAGGSGLRRCSADDALRPAGGGGLANRNCRGGLQAEASRGK
jgi:hypothetical protein